MRTKEGTAKKLKEIVFRGFTSRRKKKYYVVEEREDFVERLARAAIVVGGGSGLDLDTLRDGEHLSLVLLLLKGLLGDSLEGLLDVDGLLGRGLEVGDVSLGRAPRVGTLGRNDASVFHIDLVTQNDEGEVLRITGSGLDEELLTPAVQVLESLGNINVEHQNAAVSSTVESNSQRSKESDEQRR